MEAETLVVYSDIYLKHQTGLDHPENPNRLIAIMEGLKRFKLLERPEIRLEEPRKAQLGDVYLVHSADYVGLVENFCLRGGGILGTWGSGVVCCRESFEVALYAVGGALKAVDDVLDRRFRNSIALVRPPGHHASRELPYGFCLFNNVAIAARHLIRRRGIQRVLILDIDAHHGNGTQEVFEDDPRVLYVSFHQDRIFPGTGSIEEVGRGEGEGFKVNFPMPPYTNEQVYLKALEEVVEPIVGQFKPGYILVSAGFDAHYLDPLTGLGLSSVGYGRIFSWVKQVAEKLTDGMFTAVLEGGYDEEALSTAVPSAIAAMASLKVEVKDETQQIPGYLEKAALDVIKNVKKIMSKYWSL